MLKTSDLHKTIYADPARVVQSKVTINGTDYRDGEGERLWGLSHCGDLFMDDHPGIGGACVREIDLELLRPDEIPRMAKMEVFARLALVGPDTGITISAAEWIPRGVFYIATRSLDASGDFLSIHGYDAMLMGEQPFLDQENGETGVWPQPMPVVAAVCAAKMGVEIDPRTVINPAYTIGYPSDYTCRELLQHIAVAHAGNWTISCEGKLWLRPLVDANADILDIGSDAMDLSSAPPLSPFSMVRLWVDDEHCYEAGDDSGRLLEADCPWATQNIAESVLEAVRGLFYTPMEVTDAFCDPAVELGDLLKVTDITSPIGGMVENFCADYSATISSPGADEVETEYPYTPSATRKFDRKIAKTKSEIKVTTDQIQSTVEGMGGSISKIQQTVDGIKLEVSESIGADGKAYASITLTIGPNSYTGQILMEGNLNVSGQLSADALYAALGDIADLSVDKLSTSRRVALYLARDMSDDNYIRIHDEVIEFVSGVTDGSREQARNPSGLKIYWEDDPDGEDVVIASDGYPHKDGVRIFTTTAVTPWPVYVYSYTELVKSSQHFEMVGEHYLPVWTFGAGDQTGWNKAWMVKEADAMRLMYRTSTGKDLGIKMNNDGHTDIYGQRRGSFLDFSELPFGKFYEMVEGLDKEYSYTVERDSLGRPAKLIDDEDGHALEVRWWQQ